MKKTSQTKFMNLIIGAVFSLVLITGAHLAFAGWEYINYNIPYTVGAPLTVQVLADGLPAKTIPYNSTTVITWVTTGNPTACTCTYSSPGITGSCGTGIDLNNPVSAQYVSGIAPHLTANTTFHVACHD